MGTTPSLQKQQQQQQHQEALPGLTATSRCVPGLWQQHQETNANYTEGQLTLRELHPATHPRRPLTGGTSG